MINKLTSTHPLGGDEVAPGTAGDTLSLMKDQGLSTVCTEPPITGTAETGWLAGCKIGTVKHQYIILDFELPVNEGNFYPYKILKRTLCRF